MEKSLLLTVSFNNPHNIGEWTQNETLAYKNVSEVPLDQTPQLPKNHMLEATFPEALKLEQEASKNIYLTSNYTAIVGINIGLPIIN